MRQNPHVRICGGPGSATTLVYPTDHGLPTRCAGLGPGPIDTPTASAKHTLRALARRWMALNEEIAIHDRPFRST